jgi:hypothetical protein
VDSGIDSGAVAGVADDERDAGLEVVADVDLDREAERERSGDALS